MLQQKPCSHNVEILGGRGGHQRPPWNGNSEGVGGCKPKTFRGRGMDIFWNHTFKMPGNHFPLDFGNAGINIIHY